MGGDLICTCATQLVQNALDALYKYNNIHFTTLCSAYMGHSEMPQLGLFSPSLGHFPHPFVSGFLPDSYIPPDLSEIPRDLFLGKGKHPSNKNANSSCSVPQQQYKLIQCGRVAARQTRTDMHLFSSFRTLCGQVFNHLWGWHHGPHGSHGSVAGATLYCTN